MDHTKDPIWFCTFTLDEAQPRSAKRTFGNRISQLFGAFDWSSQEHWACEFCNNLDANLLFMGFTPRKLPKHTKNALQTIELQEWWYELKKQDTLFGFILSIYQ